MFDSGDSTTELLFSACSAEEKQQWLSGIKRGRSLRILEQPGLEAAVPRLYTEQFLNAKPLETNRKMGGSNRRSSPGGAVAATCEIVIRNTHTIDEGLEMRYSNKQAVRRSQSLASVNQACVLAPKRAERIQLEQLLADVWTRDILPFPGMCSHRSGNLMRVSAASLARKLSFASMSTRFSKYSSSLTLVGPRFSYETSLGTKLDAEDEAKESCETELDARGVQSDGNLILPCELPLHGVVGAAEKDNDFTAQGQSDESAFGRVELAVPGAFDCLSADDIKYSSDDNNNRFSRDSTRPEAIITSNAGMPFSKHSPHIDVEHTARDGGRKDDSHRNVLRLFIGTEQGKKDEPQMLSRLRQSTVWKIKRAGRALRLGKSKQA